MKKADFDSRIYDAWDPLKIKLDEYEAKNRERIKYFKKHGELTMEMVLFPPKEPNSKDAAELLSVLDLLPKAKSGRNRKKEEELVLVPRGVLKYLVKEAKTGFAVREYKKT